VDIKRDFGDLRLLVATSDAAVDLVIVVIYCVRCRQSHDWECIAACASCERTCRASIVLHGKITFNC